MTKPFYDRLEAYYSKVGEVLRGEADVAAIFPNASDIGGARENIYAEVLRMHVPSSCNVSLGGFLFDLQGYESKQIDILVTNDTSLRFDFHNRDGTGKSFACIDGCIAAVSVKSTLNTAQLRDALDNIASLPDKQPLEGRVNPLLQIPRYEDWPYKVIYASNGIGVDSIYESLCQYYDDHPEIPVNKRPNLIHVAGKYCIARVEEGGGEAQRRDYPTRTCFFCYAHQE